MLTGTGLFPSHDIRIRWKARDSQDKIEQVQLQFTPSPQNYAFLHFDFFTVSVSIYIYN